MLSLREERIQELSDLIAARMPPRRIVISVSKPSAPFHRFSVRRVLRGGKRLVITRRMDDPHVVHIGVLTDSEFLELREKMVFYRSCVDSVRNPKDTHSAL